MKRTLLYAAAGVLIGVGLHIAVVLLVPLFAINDAWARVGRLGPDGAFHLLPTQDINGSAAVGDPAVLEAACRFRLADDGAIRIRAALPDTFWSVGIIDRAGRNIYSFNDGAIEQRDLDLAILAPAAAVALGDTPPASLADAIVAEIPVEEGIAVVRVFAPDEAAVPLTAAALRAADCDAAF